MATVKVEGYRRKGHKRRATHVKGHAVEGYTRAAPKPARKSEPRKPKGKQGKLF